MLPGSAGRTPSAVPLAPPPSPGTCYGYVYPRGKSAPRAAVRLLGSFSAASLPSGRTVAAAAVRPPLARIALTRGREVIPARLGGLHCGFPLGSFAKSLV